MTIQTALLVRVSSAVDKVDHPQFFDPCYPLKSIQVFLEHRMGVKVWIRDCWIDPCDSQTLIDLACRLQPDLLVVSATSFDIHIANAFVAGIRKSGCSSLLTGIGQGMILNDDIGREHDQYYDVVLLGEPEEAFFVLFEQMKNDAGPNARWRAHYRDLYEKGTRLMVRDLDALPFSDYTNEELEAYRSIYPIRTHKRVKWGYLIAGRGCPHQCSFCSEVMRVSVGDRMRIRSGRSVADEMEHLAGQGANIISFQDDSFSSSRKLVRDVCDELTGRGNRIPWMARARVDEVDSEMLGRMKSAGCVMLGIGVEAGSQRIIKKIRKSCAPKPWADMARGIFRKARELGIGTNAYYVLGNPTETREEMEATIKLALELGSDSIQVHFHTPYPGSSDWDDYQAFIAEHDPTKMYHYAKPQFTMSEVSVDELMEIRAGFYRRYLLHPGFALRHMWHYGLFYLRNPDIFRTLVGIRKIIKPVGKP